MKKVTNAKTLPEVYYGLHMVEGVAEYAEAGKEPYRILVGEEVIKNMNPTFQGKPVYVDHVDGVDLENIQNEADGYVFESFYNKSDGKNWVKFIVVSDRGKEAIKMGWKLSNAYVPLSFCGGGQWHGVEYTKEVTGGEYEHLAIVRNPRYQESMILTPEQFKVHNGEKDIEIARLANSADKQTKEKETMKIKAYKVTKVENSLDLEGQSITLPKSKKEFLVTDIIEQFDAIQNMHGYANGDHLVKVGEEEMSVNDLVKKHIEMGAKHNDSEGEGEPGVENDEDEESTESHGEKDVGDRGGDKSLDNEEEKDEDSIVKKNASDKSAAVKAKNDKIKNAGRGGMDADEGATIKVEMSSDKVARGRARYGS
jgi:hypothetical protein